MRPRKSETKSRIIGLDPAGSFCPKSPDWRTDEKLAILHPASLQHQQFPSKIKCVGASNYKTKPGGRCKDRWVGSYLLVTTVCCRNTRSLIGLSWENSRINYLPIHNLTNLMKSSSNRGSIIILHLLLVCACVYLAEQNIFWSIKYWTGFVYWLILPEWCKMKLCKH